MSEVIREGKTKVVKSNPENPATVFLHFKDDITAGDGFRHDVFEGKASMDWAVSRDCFELLARYGLNTHYMDCPEEGVMQVRKVDRKLELEVVTRRVAAGSILEWDDCREGDRFDPTITQFHYKDDPLHDPMLDDRYIDFMVQNKEAWEYDAMRQINTRAFLILERAFAKLDVQLVDLKLEYGIIDGELCVIDEISGGSLRLWPYRTTSPDLERSNVLAELAPEQRLDKDTYRMGCDRGEVLSRFRAISNLTAQFKDVA